MVGVGFGGISRDRFETVGNGGADPVASVLLVLVFPVDKRTDF